MKINSSAIPHLRAPLSGLGWGFMGVLAFSFTVPFTRVAVGGFDPLVIAAGRAVVAALLAAAVLLVTRQPPPRGRRQWTGLAVVAGGVVLGFPIFTTYALTSVPAGHGAVVIALLPAATAVMAVIRARERPPRAFWLASGVGAAAALAFTGATAGLGGLHVADLLLFGAVLAAAAGYAEGGLLSRTLGSWQTISWALILAAPLMTVLTAVGLHRRTPDGATASEWAAFTYLAVISMFLGFFAWYRGLAIGPMSRVSQTQLTQPVLTIGWAALLLGEPLTWPTVLGGLAVIGCAALAVRSRRPSPAGKGEPAATQPVGAPGRQG